MYGFKAAGAERASHRGEGNGEVSIATSSLFSSFQRGRWKVCLRHSVCWGSCDRRITNRDSARRMRQKRQQELDNAVQEVGPVYNSAAVQHICTLNWWLIVPCRHKAAVRISMERKISTAVQGKLDIQGKLFCTSVSVLYIGVLYN